MEALRRIVNLDSLRGMIDIPSTFNYKKVELLILPIEVQAAEKKEDFEPEIFFGVSHIVNIEQAIQTMRDEWD